jgi:hypothetical protein
MKRVLVLISVIALWSLAFATPALAAAPGNDTYAGRIDVTGSLPFSDTVDTTEATTDADDAEANAGCGAPATDASVWYEFTAAADANILVDVSASDYSAGVLVATGSPGSFTVQNCGPGATAFFASSGETYAILAFDDQQDGSGNGGSLAITIDAAPPAPTVDVTVNPTGTFDRVSGSATISGTLTCTGDAVFTAVDIQLTQNVGRFTVTGFGNVFDEAPVCDGTAQPWSVEVLGSTGKFKGGRAVAVTFAIACGSFDCGYDQETTNVMLR